MGGSKLWEAANKATGYALLDYADADVDTAGNDRLLRLATALRIEHVELQSVFLEDAGVLAEFGD